MKHEPIARIRIHPLDCPCDDCSPPELDIRRVLVCAILASIPVYAVFWGIWTILPR